MRNHRLSKDYERMVQSSGGNQPDEAPGTRLVKDYGTSTNLGAGGRDYET
jgi:hypothetical protein